MGGHLPLTKAALPMKPLFPLFPRVARRGAILPALLALAACATQPTHLAQAPTAPPAPHLVTVGIAAFNDFHGQLEPPHQSVLVPDGHGGTAQVPAGGAAWLASAVDAVRGHYPNHLTLSAGDMISASQVASSLYLDEPSIGVMNRIGVDFNAVGNHEFDRGRDELLRMQNGGCAQFTAHKPCQLEPFLGASFRYLAASTVDKDGHTLFPATGLKTFGTGPDKVTVGVIGLTTRTTPTLVSPAGIAGLTFEDEAATINAAVPALKAQGADAIVVLIHEGGKQQGAPDPQGCDGMSGAILDIIKRLDPGVDLIISGHTHASYICQFPAAGSAHPLLLTSAGLYGEMVTDIALQIDPATHKVVSAQAHNVIVQSDPYQSSTRLIPHDDRFPVFTPRPDVASYVQRYVDAAKVYSSRPVGRLSGPALRGDNPALPIGGPLGNLIADSQLAATRGAGAQLALMNRFGIRTDLVPAADGTVTFGDIYRVQPFSNVLITETLTGAQLKAVLEQGLDEQGPNQGLAASANVRFTADLTRPVGSRVTRLLVDGRPVTADAKYRVTVNNFLAQGGDTFTLLADKPDAVVGMTDLDALQAWIGAVPVRQVPIEERINVIAH
ncbi:5'-nucleotidase [Novosphingobium sp. SG720]|nr:5'-nucleotidase [Novosphingobium sp. SG720]